MHIFQFYIEVTGNKLIILNITELLLKVSSFLLQNKASGYSAALATWLG